MGYACRRSNRYLAVNIFVIYPEILTGKLCITPKITPLAVWGYGKTGAPGI
jgi:hypothetical protein